MTRRIYIYIWWDLPKELIKVEFGNDKTDGRDSTCYQHSHPWHNMSQRAAENQSNSDTRSDVMQDVICSNLVSSSFVKRYTREFVIGIETACASWLGVTVACRQPPSASSWATFCKGRMRLEWRLCTASSGRRGWFYTPIIQDVWWETRGSTAQFQGVLDHHSQEIQLFSK